MSKRKPESDLKNQTLVEEENGEENEQPETHSNVSAPATEEVMKTRRKQGDPSSLNTTPTNPAETSTQNGESVKKEETSLPPKPESSTTSSAFGTPTFGATTSSTLAPNFGFKSAFGSTPPSFSLGSGSAFPSSFFSFGLPPTGNTASSSPANTSAISSSSTEATTEKPFSFGFSNTSFSFGGSFGSDFKFPSFTNLSSFNTVDADKTREATANASTSWNTDFSSVSTDTGDTSSPQSKVNLSKIEKPTTGEEGETTLSEARVRLFEFEKSNWKERGLGVIKINTDQSKYRILMRTDTTLKVILNAGIYNEMTAEEQSEKQLRFACVNSIVTEEASNPKISNFIIKFQTKQAFEDFFKALQSAKVAAGPLKKASASEEKTEAKEAEKTQEETTTKPDEDKDLKN